ncbi:MAG: acyl carrier protein [Chloroflexota bacterium]
MTKNALMLRSSIYDIVATCVAETNAQGFGRIPLEQGDDANILSGGRYIDSLGVVSLLVMIEQDLEEDLGYSLDVSTIVAQAADQNENPLATVGTLVDYLCHHFDHSTE